MMEWRTAASGLVIAMCGFGLVSCSTLAITPADHLVTGGLSRATFVGDAPSWADSATDVMRELEQWRGHRFMDDLQVTFQPQDDPGLNGWYNSATKELVVTTGSSEQMGRGVLLHEIFHALQDQHFDLYQLRLASQTQPDYDKSLTAIIEGEAMLAVSELMNYNFLDHARLPADGPIREEFFEKVFLYGAGLKFIEAVRASGGWEAVDGVFQDPPQATALILDPERYLAGERTIPLLEIPVNAGETLETTVMRGAYEVQLLLARAPELRPHLEEASRSYVTDTLGMLETADGSVVHRWLIQFDSADAASSWEDRFGKALTYDPRIDVMPSIAVEDSVLMVEW